MVWERVKDPSTGRAYYYDEGSQVTQWEFPEEVLLETLRKHGWDKAIADNEGISNAYYFSEAGESSWELPEIVISELREIFGDDLSQDEINGEITAIEDKSTLKEENTVVNGDDENEREIEQTNDTYKETNNISIPIVNKIIGLDKLEHETQDIQMEVEGKPDDLFLEMLTEKEADLTWSFKDVIEKCIDDARYWNVKDPITRSKLFEIFLVKKADEDYVTTKEKYRKEFYNLLEKHNVKYYTRWITCVKNIREEKIYTILTDRIKLDLFNEYTGKLRKEKDNASKELKAKELTELENELETLVTMSSEFAKLVSDLEQKYKNLTKGEMLSVFEKVIETREVEFAKLIEEEKKKNYRFDRKTRANFKKLLHDLIENGEFVPTSKTKWFQFVALLKDKEEFKELCGHHGSSAIDYYWDMLDNVYQSLNEKKHFAKTQLINFNKKINDVNEDQFIQLMKKSNKAELSNLLEDDLKSLYAILCREAGIDLSIGNKRSAEFAHINAAPSNEKRQKILLRKGN